MQRRFNGGEWEDDEGYTALTVELAKLSGLLKRQGWPMIDLETSGDDVGVAAGEEQHGKTADKEPLYVDI